MTRDTSAPPPQLLALVRVGEFRLAVDAKLLDSVIPGPLQVSPFPRALAHVPGAFAWRGTSMPLLDIHALLAPRAHDAMAPVRLAAILRSTAGRFAMPIDAIGDVVRPTAGSLTALDVHSPQGAGLFSRLYAASDGTVWVVLDLEAILSIDDLRTGIHTVADQHADTAADTDSGPLHVVCRAGAALFAIDINAVRHVEKRTAGDSLAMPHPSLRGFHRFRDHTLAVVDLLSLLELPPSEAPNRESHLLMVGTRPPHVVALVVDEIVSLARLRPGAVQPIPDAASASAALYRGSTVVPGRGATIVLDPDALLQAASIVDPRLFDAADAARQDRTVQATAPMALHMVYIAGGGSLASRLIELDAIVQLRADFTDLRRESSPLVGLCAHGAGSVPVLDLSQLMGKPPVEPVVHRPVLMVRTADGICGLLVEQLLFLQSAAPVPMPGHGRRASGVMPALTEMIRARRNGADHSAAVLPLGAIAFQGLTADAMQGEAA